MSRGVNGFRINGIVIRKKLVMGPAPAVTPRGAVVQMGEIGSTGIYEGDVTFLAAWGLGDFTVMCSDGTAADRMVIRVTSLDVEDLGLQLAGVSNQVLSLETGITNVVNMVSNVVLQTSDMLQIVTNLDAGISNLLVQTAGMRWYELTNLLSGVSNLTATVRDLSTLTNLTTIVGTLTNINWSGLSNINVLAIAHGSSDVSVSMAVESVDTEKAVRSLHELIVK